MRIVVGASLVLLCAAVASVPSKEPARSQAPEFELLDAARYGRVIDPPATAARSTASGENRKPQADIPPFPSAAYPYFATLARYTFDNGGAPDAQGWTTHDLTVQDGVYFHVDDFAGMAAPYAPLAGTKSMWCGRRAGAPSDPAFQHLPGYGNRWVQFVQSSSIPVGPGPVTIYYYMHYDLFTSDRVDVEYRSLSGTWTLLQAHLGINFPGGELYLHTVPEEEVGSSIQFRFVLSSDFRYSDEDVFDTNGGVIIDDVTVQGIGFFGTEDFESAFVGSNFAGIWSASAGSSFGNFAGLVSGASVVQSGPLNTSNMWSFFNGSSATYACGGFPSQAALPYTTQPGSRRITDYLVNEVRSPYIDISVDENNNPVSPTETVSLEFDVYADLPMSSRLAFTYRYRFLVGANPTPWRDPGALFFSTIPQWIHIDTSPYTSFLIPPGATHVQVSLVAIDGAHTSGFVSTCHTHAPLFDNVAVRRVMRPYFVENVNDAGPGSLRLALTNANGSPNSNAILFSIPGAGPHTIAPASPLPSITQPVWIDGLSQSGSSPNSGAAPTSDAALKVALQGTSAGAGANGLHFAPGSSGVVRGLAIGGFSSAGIRSDGNEVFITGCHIGTDASGTAAMANGVGVHATSPGTEIGGVYNEDRCVIAGNTGDGVRFDTSGRVANTHVGVAADGSALGNGGHGVHVTAGTFLQVGEETATPCELPPTDRTQIAYNAGDGIRVEPAATGAGIRHASIHDNSGLGIDLGGDGPTANDQFDEDTGANGLTNHPIITSANGTTIAGHINAEQRRAYRVEFFASPSCDGEGRQYLGYSDVMTTSFGSAPISFTCGVIPPATVVTATATNTFDGSTSEFSPCVTSMNTPPGSPLVNLYDSSGIQRGSVFFGSVTTGGNTFIAPTAPPEPVPSNWVTGPNPTYWDITTTASYPVGSLQLYLHYDENDLPGPEEELHILHFNGSEWEDITDDLDTAGNRVGGPAWSLSPFVIVVPAAPTGIGDDATPTSFALHTNVPNPFNPQTMIQYDVPAGGADVSISIYDVSGRLVRDLVNQHRAAGRWSVQWNGEGARGERVASGVYFYRMRAGSFVDTKKMVLLK